jgi:hypothetical protein
VTAITFSPDARAQVKAFSDEFTGRYKGRSDDWVYDGGTREANDLRSFAGEVAAGFAMGATHLPSVTSRFDFVASGWRVDVKTTTKGWQLMIRQGHVRKIGTVDAFALVRWDSPARCTFLGWIWADEFRQKAEPADTRHAKHTEPALAMPARKLLRPAHWRYLSMCQGQRDDALGPPWPGSQGPRRNPISGRAAEWSKLCEGLSLTP